jgi:hypothetical protein
MNFPGSRSPPGAAGTDRIRCPRIGPGSGRCSGISCVPAALPAADRGAGLLLRRPTQRRRHYRQHRGPVGRARLRERVLGGEGRRSVAFAEPAPDRGGARRATFADGCGRPGSRPCGRPEMGRSGPRRYPTAAGHRIAVGITPQLLPAVVSSSLAAGSRRMSYCKVLVKRLVCIKDLGDVDVLFTDKTGTLTLGRFDYVRAIPTDGSSPEQVLRWGLLCTENTADNGAAVGGNPLDQALWDSPAGADVEGAIADYTSALLTAPLLPVRTLTPSTMFDWQPLFPTPQCSPGSVLDARPGSCGFSGEPAAVLPSWATGSTMPLRWTPPTWVSLSTHVGQQCHCWPIATGVQGTEPDSPGRSPFRRCVHGRTGRQRASPGRNRRTHRRCWKSHGIARVGCCAGWRPRWQRRRRPPGSGPGGTLTKGRKAGPNRNPGRRCRRPGS